jgi:hypothetical protein
MKPLYIFDLDGTIALATQRQHLLDNKEDPQRWDKFYEACHMDLPNPSIVATLNILRLAADIWIFSGRSDQVRGKTVDWLLRYTELDPILLRDGAVLRMRPQGDFTADDELKRSWVMAMHSFDRARLVAAFDDRDRVVTMWRALNVPCFQVAPGDF